MKPDGNGSVSTTSCASDGPLLVNVMVYDKSLPATTGSIESVLTTWRSADGAPVLVSSSVLFVGFGSNVSEVTVAVLYKTVALGPVAPTTVIVRNSPVAMIGKSQEMPAPSGDSTQLSDGCTDRPTNPAGKVSVT